MRRAFLLVLLPILVIAACAAPAPDSPTGSEVVQEAPKIPATAGQSQSAQPQAGTPALPTPAPTIPPARRKPPRMGDPLPPQRLPAPVRLDRSCRADADCVVKNVGNCCGYYPACVHKASATDPAAVQAQCAKDGMASVCGFAEIESCDCVQGQCIAGGTATAPGSPAVDQVR